MSQSAQMSEAVQITSSEPATLHVDMDHLLHYTMGDEKLAREVLGLFSTQGRLYLEQLASATDAKGRKAAAHTLKGSAQGVGAHDVANKAYAAEQLAESGDETAWNQALGELETAFAGADGFIANLD